MRTMFTSLAAALIMAACAGGAADTIADMPADKMLERADGTQVTVQEQWNHLHALIDDEGYGTICGTLMTAEAGESEGGQTQEDVESLHELHKAACDDVRDDQ